MKKFKTKAEPAFKLKKNVSNSFYTSAYSLVWDSIKISNRDSVSNSVWNSVDDSIWNSNLNSISGLTEDDLRNKFATKTK